MRRGPIAPGGGGGGGDFIETRTVPAAANWQTFGSTGTDGFAFGDTDDGVAMSRNGAVNTTDIIGATLPIPNASSFTVTMGVVCNVAFSGSASASPGVLMTLTDGTKYLTAGLVINSSANNLWVTRWNTNSSIASQPLLTADIRAGTFTGNVAYMRFTASGGTLTFSTSRDGKVFTMVGHTENLTLHLSTITRWGLGLYGFNNGSGAYPSHARIIDIDSSTP